MADTVVEPWTVVIHLKGTASAHAAVMSSRWLGYYTVLADRHWAVYIGGRLTGPRLDTHVIVKDYVEQ